VQPVPGHPPAMPLSPPLAADTAPLDGRRRRIGRSLWRQTPRRHWPRARPPPVAATTRVARSASRREPAPLARALAPRGPKGLNVLQRRKSPGPGPASSTRRTRRWPRRPGIPSRPARRPLRRAVRRQWAAGWGPWPGSARPAAAARLAPGRGSAGCRPAGRPIRDSTRRRMVPGPWPRRRGPRRG
jgi:hypothetical protein